MAEKRMFSKKVTDSDSFIELPSTTQALYFHLNQGADDDGFNNQIQLAMTKAHASPDDLKLLIVKNFVLKFENGIIVIKHWRLHNTLRKDRYAPTEFQEEIHTLNISANGVYTTKEIDEICIGNQMATTWQPLGNPDKNRLDKNRLDNSTNIDSNNIYELFEKSFGRTISPLEYENIAKMLSDYSEEFVKKALSEAVSRNAFSLVYIERILINWKSNNLQTIEDVEKFIEKFHTKKNITEETDDLEFLS